MADLDLSLVPKDRPILVKIDGKWIQAEWCENGTTPENEWEGWWDVVILPFHGCGCCMAANPAFTDWKELP